MWRDAHAHRVDQAVLLVGRLEVDLAADGGHSDAVAVVADALDHPVEEKARARRVELAEAKRVEHRDRTGADGEDVTQDAAHPGGRALEGLHRAGVVVRLDLEGHRQAIPHVHDSGVLARPHEQVRALDRELSKQLLRVLVGAVLGPHEREHRQLEVVGIAPQAVADAVVLGVRQAELAMRGRGGVAHATGMTATDSKIRPPSADPVRGSTACSGCGISPTTLASALHTPAMSSCVPLGFWPGA